MLSGLPSETREMNALESWWVSLDWGTVPDWFAAVGTVGALVATLVIIAVDRYRVRRAPAHGLVLWSVRRYSSTSSGDKQFVTVHASNVSNGPIPVANVFSRVDGSDYIDEILTADDNGFKEIAPGGKVEKEIEIVHYIDESNIFVFFVDHRGGKWAKRLSDGRLLSARKGRRLAGID